MTDEQLQPTLFLVRHGIVDMNTGGLSTLGQRQASALGESALAWSCNAIFSSPIRRASDTAAAIGRVIGILPEPMDAFREGNLHAAAAAIPAVIARGASAIVTHDDVIQFLLAFLANVHDAATPRAGTWALSAADDGWTAHYIEPPL